MFFALLDLNVYVPISKSAVPIPEVFVVIVPLSVPEYVIVSFCAPFTVTVLLELTALPYNVILFDETVYDWPASVPVVAPFVVDHPTAV